MTRNLRALGLALVAVLALGAVLASAASATPRITVSKYPATLKGEQKGINEFILPGGRKFKCSKANFTGEYTKTQSEAATWSISAIPSYEECTAEILGNIDPVTVTMNSCYFTFTSGETKNASTTEQTGTVHVKCTVPGDKIEVHVWENSTKHKAGEATLCTYTIPEVNNQNLASVTYTLSSGGSANPHTYVTINANVKNIHVTRSSGTLTNCGAAEQKGEYLGEAKIEALKEGEMLEGSMDPS
jgi:hypothetical protein